MQLRSECQQSRLRTPEPFWRDRHARFGPGDIAIGIGPENIVHGDIEP